MRKIHDSLFIYGEHLIVVIIAGFLFGLFYAVIHIDSSILDPISRALGNFELSDLYYNVDRHTGYQAQQSEDITLVDIGEMRSREDIAHLLKAVEECDPTVVGVDILFEGQHDDAKADYALSSTVQGLRRTVFACKMFDYDVKENGFQRTLKPFFAEDFTPKMGYVNTVGDISMTCVRKLSVQRKCEGQYLLSLPACMAETKKPGCLPVNRDEDWLIGYKNIEFPVVKAASVKAHADLLKDRIVFVGVLNKEEDVLLTPLGRLNGMKVLAYSTQTLLSQQNIQKVGMGWTFVIILLVAYLTVVWQWVYVKMCSHKMPRPLFYFLGNSSSIINLLTILWMAVLACAGYLVYDRYGCYISMVYLFAFIILVSEARNIYIAIVDTFRKFGRSMTGNKFKNWLATFAARSKYVFD